MNIRRRYKTALTGLLALGLTVSAASPALAIRWERALRQGPEWFQSDEAKQVVANVLLYQYPSGGWPKNIDMARPLSAADKERLKRRRDEGTIDNGGTYTQLRFLAQAYSATRDESVLAAFNNGIDYLFAAQYENGGWPLFYPLRKGYYTHIHFNDDSVSGVIELMDDIARGKAPFEFVDGPRRERAGQAVEKGIDCILKSQVMVDGKRTAWCAQHDEVTLAPAPARAFEPVSYSGRESVGLVRCLMRVDNPSPEIIDAVQSAVEWFDKTRIEGIRVVRVQIPEGWDRKIEQDSDAPPLWARFYELGTNRPIFAGRSAEVHYDYSKIEPERRRGYAYYGDWPARLLRDDYPRWTRKWRIEERG